MEFHTATMADDAQQAFYTLLDRNRGIVFKVVNTYGHHPADREDLAQEIATQLWRAFPGYDPARSFTTWMYRIALNVAISFVRTKTHRDRHAVPLDEQLHDLPAPAENGHESYQQLRVLLQFIDKLGRLDRALLLLYLEDQSHREIAEILGISETNVATKTNRLKQRIRNEL